MRKIRNNRDSLRGEGDAVDLADGSGGDYEAAPIPEWLENSLAHWLEAFAYEYNSWGYQTGPNLEFVLFVERLTRCKLLDRTDQTLDGPARAVLAHLQSRPEHMWLILDELVQRLFLSKHAEDAGRLTNLIDILVQGGAAYEVAFLDDRLGLRQRIPAGVREGVDKAIYHAGRASKLLSSALAKTYGRDPDYSGAYSKAIKAVEAVTIPIVLPKDNKATLGKVIPHIRAHQAEWSLSLQDPGGKGVESLVNLLEVLWTSETDRHAGNAPLEDVTKDEAEAAVHLATMVVYWFARTGIHKVG